MKEEYLWEIKNQEEEETLQKDINTDILIIGGGITGISIAFELRNSNKKIIAVDQYKCGNGVTMRTTGKLTYLQDDIYSKLTKAYNEDIAKLYLQSQKEAIKLAQKNIKDYQIDCDFQEVDSYLFITDEKNKGKLEKEKQLLKQWAEVQEHEQLPVDFSCLKAISVPKTAVFHPLKYLLALKEICKKDGVKFYENTMTNEIVPDNDGYKVYANNHIITAKSVIVSCHYPSFVMPGWIPLKTYLEKSYIGAIPIDKVKNFSAINLDKDVFSFRYHTDKRNNYLIFLSETHKLSNDVDYQTKVLNLKEKINQHLNKTPDYIWSNYDLMTNDSLPIIGRINDDNPNLYLATGFNTWGMTNGILSGKIISDLINKKDNPYIELFNPSRKLNLTKLTNDVINDFNMTKIFLQTKIKKNYDFYPSNVKFITKNGKKYGVYTDEKGKEHVVSNLCPHMKCSLVFNPTTTTWDCPCHGSRFDIDGNVLKGPSNYNIKIK